MSGNISAARAAHSDAMAFPGIISLMRALDGGALSLVEIAAAVDLSSADVAARLAVLRDVFGAAEENDRGEWRLVFRPQWLDKKLLSAEFANSDIAICDETESTNELARVSRLPNIFFAEHQTHGRGRRGQCWMMMPAANIAATIRLPLFGDPSGFSLAVGASLWRTLGGAKSGLRLKWPNDLLNARGEKVGGVLIEMRGDEVMAGVGINLMMTAQLRRQLNRPAAALPHAPSRNACAALVCRAVLFAADEFARAGLAAFLADARAAHFLRNGDAMRLHCGDEEVRGSFAGFGGDGALLIRRAGGGVREYVAGEIANVAGG